MPRRRDHTSRSRNDPTVEGDKVYDFNYQFIYRAFAGDLLIPPYPLNLVIGNVKMSDARGGNYQAVGTSYRSLWRDVNLDAWVVSGGGRFFHRFFYPFREDFFLPGSVATGTPVAWVPREATDFTGTGKDLMPQPVDDLTFWRSDCPKLKRGESLTCQGGEYFHENP